jgi:hypothetical protein
LTKIDNPANFLNQSLFATSSSPKMLELLPMTELIRQRTAAKTGSRKNTRRNNSFTICHCALAYLKGNHEISGQGTTGKERKKRD